MQKEKTKRKLKITKSNKKIKSGSLVPRQWRQKKGLVDI
jgi:hypothetical protein